MRFITGGGNGCRGKNEDEKEKNEKENRKMYQTHTNNKGMRFFQSPRSKRHLKLYKGALKNESI